MKTYILFEKDNATLPLAIIAKKEDYAHFLHESIKTAIAENFCTDKEDIYLKFGENITDPFFADMVDDNENIVREFYLVECLTY